jgi:hypothetical protein
MKELKVARNKLRLVNIALYSIAAVWGVVFLFFFDALPSDVEHNTITGMVFGSSTVLGPYVGSGDSVAWGFLAFLLAVLVLTGALFFYTVRYKSRLKSLFVIHTDKNYLKITPNEAIMDFFDVLVSIVVKGSNVNYSYMLLESVRNGNEKDVPFLANLSVRLDKNKGDIEISIKGKADWDQFYDIYRLYLRESHLDKEKFLSVAGYEQKDDLVIAIGRLDVST